MGVALTRICEQYPSIQIDRNVETKEVVVKGLGDVHIDVAVKLMKQQSNAAVETSVPKVAYRESVTGMGEGHYRHKKQTGGRGQFGEVFLRVMPLPEGETEWFVNKVVGGAIPGNFIPAAQKGVQEGLLAGAVARYPVQKVKVEIYDGSYHDVDSSALAFEIAGRAAMREVAAKAGIKLLEPVMKVEVVTPEEFMGDVIGDLNSRRGQIQGTDSRGIAQVVEAIVPLANMFGYVNQLRSFSQGRASYSMQFSHYEEVPTNVAEEVKAKMA